MQGISYACYNLWIGTAPSMHDLFARARRRQVPVLSASAGLCTGAPLTGSSFFLSISVSFLCLPFFPSFAKSSLSFIYLLYCSNYCKIMISQHFYTCSFQISSYTQFQWRLCFFYPCSSYGHNVGFICKRELQITKMSRF